MVFVVFLLDIGAVPTVVFVVFLLDIGAVPTVRYFFFCSILELFRQCRICCFSVRYWSCSDSVVFVVFLLDFGTVRQCGISCFLLDFGTVPTVWYVLELFRQW